MGTETTVFVKVTREMIGWIEVQAVTLEQAKSIAKMDPEVVRVLDAQYAEPYTETET